VGLGWKIVVICGGDVARLVVRTVFCSLHRFKRLSALSIYKVHRTLSFVFVRVLFSLLFIHLPTLHAPFLPLSSLPYTLLL